ncbi:hypothetical protein [Herbaspirillum sp. 1130]|uniref:hypothetical protein n=1 Tax=Herbaspirillum sp. 1130 TaxID=2806562 RepID=UPI000EB3ECAD|nr:hypothetical protein [Herbaspirillum sp. 1130]MBP1317805.1 hypothetical protein [Herbaspirillum sp. 1130]
MLIFVMATAMLGGCGNGSGAEHRAMDERIHIQLGQSGDDILKNYPGLFSMSDHPSGAKFYAARWTKDARGTVEIGPSETLFVIHHALSATGNYSPSFANENIIEWNINAGLAESSLIMHDDARKQFQSIRANLRKASWHRYIDPDAPPACRVQTHYAMQNPRPPFMDWIRITSQPWTNGCIFPGARFGNSGARRAT